MLTALIGTCELTSCITVTVDFNTGIATTSASGDDWFTVQPNPSNGVFQLIPASDRTTMNITVYDATGRTVKSPVLVAGHRTVSIDLGAVSPGSCYLIATREGDQRVSKLIVKN